jgi:quinone-modifying oxidoreductase, subunit QmoB
LRGCTDRRGTRPIQRHLKAVGASTEWDAPDKVTADQQDLINKGELEDPNKGLQKYTP